MKNDGSLADKRYMTKIKKIKAKKGISDLHKRISVSNPPASDDFFGLQMMAKAA